MIRNCLETPNVGEGTPPPGQEGTYDVIEHIVLFQMKRAVTASQKQAFVQALREMKGRIPGMVDLSAGESFTDRHQGFTVGLVVRFVDEDALQAYGPHPVHAPIKQMAAELCESVLAVDYVV